MIKILFLMVVGLLSACSTEEKLVDYSKIRFEDQLPINVEEDTLKKDVNGLNRKINLLYISKWGDSLEVSVLEFKGDVYALDYYTNSGKFQGTHAILRGKLMEQSFRANSKIFTFKYDSFRRYERSVLENYFLSIPGVRPGFPQEFLSLPFEHREPGKTTVQTKYFLGLKKTFPIIEQSYDDGNLNWNVARSWGDVDELLFKSWTEQLKKVKPKGLIENSDYVYFDAGDYSRGIATQLPGGRVVIVWGYLDWRDLERRFKIASDRIYESRY